MSQGRDARDVNSSRSAARGLKIKLSYSRPLHDDNTSIVIHDERCAMSDGRPRRRSRMYGRLIDYT
eukprot:6950701-Prymnesium_polylepis.1